MKRPMRNGWANVVGVIIVGIMSVGAAAPKGSAEEILARFEAKTYTDRAGKTLPYRLFTPKVEAGKKYPVVLFLHGAGGRGKDNKGQILDGKGNCASKWALAEYQAKFPCYIVAPQVPEGKQWVAVPWGDLKHTIPAEPTDELRMAKEVLDGMVDKDPAVDGARVYVTGLSMGGFGAWDIVARHPDFFAAAVPVCGGADEATAAKLKHVPIWIFHGEKDGVVKTARSRNMSAALGKAGNDVTYTEFPGVGHDSWTPAYRNEELQGWMFSKKLGSKGH
jgi:predicted peptidase